MVSATSESDAVVSVLPIWNMYTPSPLRVSTPVNCAEEEKL